VKLLFILPEYAREQAGGIRTFYCSLLPALAAAGCRVKVLVACRGTFDAPSFTDESGVAVEYLRKDLFEKYSRSMAGSPFAGWPTLGHYVPLGLAAYEQVRAGEGFDAVEVTDWPLYFLPWVAQGARAPLTISLHSSIGQMRFHEPLPGWETETHFLRLLEAASFAAAASVHTNSNLNAKYWEKITGRKVHVLLPMLAGGGERGAQPEDRDRRPDVREQGAEVGGRRGAVFARLQTWKGAEVLAEALRLAPRVSVDWYGRTVPSADGRRGYDAELAEKFSDVWGTRFVHRGVVGHEEVLQTMRNAAFVCVPSLWDVFNLTVVEAMQQGAVVICSKRAGAEMLIEEGKNGFCFDPARPESLAVAMEKCCSMNDAERAVLADGVCRTITSRFSTEKLLAERLDYYRAVPDQGSDFKGSPFLKAFMQELQSEGALQLGWVRKISNRLRAALRAS
jgi:glycosyltransferase involved in cell wall biosynthesis